MKECYHCKTSFVHAGDPIDGNDFCGHSCSAEYIHRVKEIERAREDMPRFKAYMERNNLMVVDNKLVSKGDEDETEKQTEEEVQTKVD